MPKQKTRRSSAKRFKPTVTGKIRRRKAFANHFLGKKGSPRKRRLNSPDEVSKADRKRVRRMLGV